MSFVVYLFIFCCCFQIIYQLLLLSAVLSNKPSANDTVLPIADCRRVSVVICARNEAINLEKNLPFILMQNYPDFEVIVVDDGSQDNTKAVLQNFMERDSRISFLFLSAEEKTGLGKKNALQKGIQHARNEIILLTDADCKPASAKWIYDMSSKINSTKKIVLGISPYETKSTLLNMLIEYETAQTALQYSGFALLGMPYMSVGRNVGYDKNLLLSKVWTNTELSIASGDDDLTIQSLADRSNTAVCLSTESYMISEPEKNWAAWIQQKLRHYEPGKLYKTTHRLVLGSYLFTKLLAYLSFIMLAVAGFLSPVIFYFFMAYLFGIMFLHFILEKNTELNSRWYSAPFCDLLYGIFTIALGITSQFKPIKKWS